MIRAPLRALAIAALVGLCSVCGGMAAAKDPPLLSESAPDAYRLGAGDELRITVFGLDAANNTYLIGDSGSFSVPLVGSLSVAGKTPAEVEAMLAETLRSRQIIRDPNVSVQIAKYRPFFILGEVQKPGQYPYVPGMTVVKAVSIAGGYTFRANKKKALISRSTDGEASEGRATPNTRVMPGDTVSIPESWF